MTMDDVAARGLVLLGCGKMGSALLDGWLKGGLPAASVWVIDPQPIARVRVDHMHAGGGQAALQPAIQQRRSHLAAAEQHQPARGDIIHVHRRSSSICDRLGNLHELRNARGLPRLWRNDEDLR